LIVMVLLAGCEDRVLSDRNILFGWEAVRVMDEKRLSNDFSDAEDMRVQLGCCMFSLSSCFLSMSNKFSPALVGTVQIDHRWSFDVGYSPGICQTNSYFRRGESFFDPVKAFYWLNFLEISARRHMSVKFDLVGGSGYMWRKRYLDRSAWCVPLLIGIEHRLRKVQYYFYKLQLEVYLWKYHAEKSFLTPGGGISFSFGTKPKLSDNLRLILTPTIRLGLVKSYEGDVPVALHPTGVYLNLGISYSTGRIDRSSK